MTIVAVIPAHDEASRIQPVLRAALGHLPVIVVDDGSRDGTAVVARAAGATVIEQHPNRGKGFALRRGFREAIARGAEAAVTLDADGQHDPREIPAFLEAWAMSHPDLVVGRRDFRAMPPVRRLANELGGRLFSWAVGRTIPDNQSGYRLVSRRLMEASLASDEHGFEFEVELITTTIRMGGSIAWVPIRTIYGGESSHIRPLRHLRQFLRICLKARRAVRAPLAAS
ncbi:MAG: glycosyltransferase family 2 protein [Chloroflexota bacterium]